MSVAHAERRTVVVHTKAAGHMTRVAAARGDNGVQIVTMGQLTARFAGALLRPVDPDALRKAVRESLPAVAMGELEPIRSLTASFMLTPCRYMPLRSPFGPPPRAP